LVIVSHFLFNVYSLLFTVVNGVVGAKRNATNGIWVPKGIQRGKWLVVASHVSIAACFSSMVCVLGLTAGQTGRSYRHRESRSSGKCRAARLAEQANIALVWRTIVSSQT
jgi:hypothetical protein